MNKKFKIKSCDGQATIEAAVMIPVIFILILLLIQPSIILYDKIVMNSAAIETCRLLSTCNDVDKQKICENFIRRRLSAIPQQDNFHIHTTGCSYSISLVGNQNDNYVKVSIKNELKPLPLIGFLGDLIGILNENKNFEINVSYSQVVKPDWVKQSLHSGSIENSVGKWIQ